VKKKTNKKQNEAEREGTARGTKNTAFRSISPAP
jgi:hypothetical protein